MSKKFKTEPSNFPDESFEIPQDHLDAIARHNDNWERARVVFDFMAKRLNLPDDPIELGKVLWEHNQKLDELIRENIDHGSIAFFGMLFEQDQQSMDARVNAMWKLRCDPKQQAKTEVKELWELWQKNPMRYKSVSAFARDMLEKFEVLESSQVIGRWCKEWKKQANNDTEQA